MKTALLISTYNWPEALSVVLKSLEAQTQLPDEVIIADDGSGETTKVLIKDCQNEFAIPVKHIWQKDKGFRRSAVLNKAIASTTADYIIQIDGDCIMNRNFVKDHLDLLEEKTYLFGSRVNIKPGAVKYVLEKQRSQFLVVSRKIKNRSRNIRIPFLRNMYEKKSEFSRKTRGCNISYWRRDFIAVNGYDENMEGWGREDSEFVLRLLNNGVEGKRLRYGGIIYHIHHPGVSKDKLAENNQIQEKTIREKKVWCINGVDKYLNAPPESNT